MIRMLNAVIKNSERRIKDAVHVCTPHLPGQANDITTQSYNHQ